MNVAYNEYAWWYDNLDAYEGYEFEAAEQTEDATKEGA